MDALECQGRRWEYFISRKTRTSYRKQAKTHADTQKEAMVTKERGKSSGGRIKKRSLENPIGGRIPKKRVRFTPSQSPCLNLKRVQVGIRM